VRRVGDLAGVDLLRVLPLLVPDALVVLAGRRDRDRQRLLAGRAGVLEDVPELAVGLAVELVEDRRRWGSGRPCSDDESWR
jgi:hypothetical protein